MKIFTVHSKEESPVYQEDIYYIEEGFSWLGFICNVFWLIYYRLWTQVIAFVVIFITLGQLRQYELISMKTYLIFSLGIYIYIGFSGRDFVRKNLEKEGYRLQDVVLANSIDEAEFAYMKSALKEQNDIRKIKDAKAKN